MNSQAYSLCGLTIDLLCREPRQGAEIDELWRRLFVLDQTDMCSSNPSLCLDFTRRKGVREPHHAQVVFESSAVRVLRTKGGFYLHCGESRIDLQVSLSTGVRVLDDGFWSFPLQDQREFFLLTFLMLMRRHGLYGLHASALSREEFGCLIVGNSGKGKTTLTIALVKEGWRYLSDDAAMLRESEEGVQALAFRQGFSLTPQTADQFPELVNSEVGQNGGRGFPVSWLGPPYPPLLADCGR